MAVDKVSGWLAQRDFGSGGFWCCMNLKSKPVIEAITSRFRSTARNTAGSTPTRSRCNPDGVSTRVVQSHVSH